MLEPHLHRRARRILPSRAAILAGIALVLASGESAAAPRDRGEAPWSYSRLCEQLLALEPDPSRVARVASLVIERDAGLIVLEEGTLALAKPIHGRVCAAFFKGRGRFRFQSNQAVERAQLERYFKKPLLLREFESLVLLFADSTAAELASAVQLGPEDFEFSPGALTAHFRDFVVEKTRYVDPSLARTLLEGRTNGHFVALLECGRERLRFEIDPYRTEEISLTRVSDGPASEAELVSQFRSGGRSSRDLDGDTRPGFAVHAYTIDVEVPDNLRPRYAAQLECEALEDSIRFLPFYLGHFEDAPDSARLDGGEPLRVFARRENPVVWIDAGRSLARGERFRLDLRWRSRALEEDEGMVAVDHLWYPIHDFGNRATYDLTFRYPSSMTLVSVGDRIAEERRGATTFSHWRTAAPIRHATWHIGDFKQRTIEGDSIPAVTVLIDKEGHTGTGLALLADEGIAPGRNMEEQVAQDLRGSLTFFRHVYGPLPTHRLWGAESRAVEGEAFPGMITMGWHTFQWTDAWGADDVLRAHEVAHQWWPLAVGYKTYRDRWLSEGLAQFSGLWYMQAKRQKNELYLRALRDMRDRLELHPDAGSTWLGRRVETTRTVGPDYVLAVYYRGAWIFHMLRNLLIDLDTMDEGRFLGLMRELYREHQGDAVSTADFQALVEKHAGMEMGWFFRQWVEDTAIPRYEVSWSSAPEGGRHRVKLHVVQRGVSEDFRMVVPIRVDLADGRFARMRVWVRGASSDIDLPLLPAAPRHVEFDEFESVLCTVKSTGK